MVHARNNSGYHVPSQARNQHTTGKVTNLRPEPKKAGLDPQMKLDRLLTERALFGDGNAQMFLEACAAFGRQNPDAPSLGSMRGQPLRNVPMWMLFLLVGAQLISATEATTVRPEHDFQLKGPVDRITVHKNSVTLYGKSDDVVGQAAFKIHQSDCPVLSTATSAAPAHDRFHPDVASMEAPHAHFLMGSGRKVPADAPSPQVRPVSAFDLQCITKSLKNGKLIDSEDARRIEESLKAKPLPEVVLPPSRSDGTWRQLDVTPGTAVAYGHARELLGLKKDISRAGPLEEAYLHFDIGGEGPHVQVSDGMRSGFDSAINLNGRNKMGYTLQTFDAPCLVEVDWKKPLPVAAHTADEISMQGAPFYKQNMDEIARMIRPGGYITLWVDEMPSQGATFAALAKAVGGTVVYPDPSHPKHDKTQLAGIPEHILHAEQSSFSMHRDRVIIRAADPKPSVAQPTLAQPAPAQQAKATPSQTTPTQTNQAQSTHAHEDL